MADYLTNYSLTIPPFAIAPLNPLAAADAKLIVPVQGIANYQEVDQGLGMVAAKQAPLFVLVTGGQNCGLTSAAHCIVARYAEQRQLAPENIIDLNYHPSDHDAASFWLSWISKLIDELDIRRWEVTPDLSNKIEAALAALLPAEKSAAAAQLGIRFRPLLRKLSFELGKGQPARGFVARIEGIQSPDFLTIAFDLFSTCSTICSFVVADYADGREKVIARFKEFDGDKVVVKMAPLTGAEAETVVRARWKSANPPIEEPFEAQSIEQAFLERPRPLKRVLVLMNQVLTHKATVEFPSKIWPHDTELGIKGEELKRRIGFIEDEVLGKR